VLNLNGAAPSRGSVPATRTFLNTAEAVSVVRNFGIVHIGAATRERSMDELNGKLIACQILITGLIARVANEQRDPLRFLTDFRDEIKAVVNGVNIAGMDSTDRVRAVAQKTVDELFSLMKPPSSD
jgi:putative N-acetylmannosamine-6-phosphate epimerase